MATTRFKDHLLVGTTGSRPAASAVPAGTLYASSSDGNIYQSDGTSAWSTWLAAPGGTSGAWTLLQTTTIAGSAAAFDVSSISGSYNDLLLMLIGRASKAVTTDSVMLRFNNDSTSGHYATEQVNSSGGSNSAFEQTSDTKITPGSVPGDSATAGLFGTMEILIPGYASTTWSKVVLIDTAYALNVTSTNIQVTRGTAFWNSTAAINRVQLLINDSPNTFLIGSQLRIYGRL